MQSTHSFAGEGARYMVCHAQRKLLNITRSESASRARATAIFLPSCEKPKLSPGRGQ
jgi:hypothetical protein